MYRLIIADDEPIECRALEHKIHSIMPDLILLPSVYDGLSLMKAVRREHPDIVIVDINMPGVTGLEAVELLKSRNPDLKVIINTSYSDFSYIRKALQLGAGDYLLKPGSREALRSALEKMTGQLDRERAERTEREAGKHLVGRLLKLAEEKWIHSLLTGRQDPECMSAIAEQYPAIEEGGFFTVWETAEADGSVPHRSISGNAVEQIRSLLSDLCSCAGGLYEGRCYFFLMMWENKLRKNSSAHSEEAETPGGSPEEMLHHVQQLLKKNGLVMKIGCSRYKPDPDSYAAGIHEAQAALRSGRSELSFFRRENEETKTPLPDLFDGISSAVLHASGNNPETASDLLRRRLQDTVHAAHQLNMSTDMYRSQAIFFLSRLRLEAELLAGSEDALFLSVTDWKSLRESCTTEDIAAFLLRLAGELYSRLRPDHSSSKHSAYVSKTLRFIHNNYGEDLSLEEIAERLDISAFYLSRLLRQELDETFVEILTDVRIRAAVELLRRDRQISGAQTAAAVGYTSAAYFYRVFKKTTGLTFGQMKGLPE